MASIELVPVRPEHVPELGRICHVAFSTLHERHRVSSEVATLEVGQMIVGSIATRADCAGVAAVVDGRIVGSNFLLLADEVAGVGPITVDPDAQSHGIGRTLMQWAIDEAGRRGKRHVRLFQEAVNTTSLPLYTKLGFRWRDAAALMLPRPAARDDDSIRPITSDDLAQVERLSEANYGSSRAHDAAKLIEMPLPGFVRERGGRIVGYHFATLFGHGAAERNDDLLALVAHAARHVPPPMSVFLCPLSEHDLFSASLARGDRVQKMLNYMSLDAYAPPPGVWFPSISC